MPTWVLAPQREGKTNFSRSAHYGALKKRQIKGKLGPTGLRKKKAKRFNFSIRNTKFWRNANNLEEKKQRKKEGVKSR